MPTIRRVPEVYPTIQSAHDDAADGDTVLIAPGNYRNGADAMLVWRKRVHIKGDGDNPADVLLGQTYDGFTGPALDLRLPSGTVGDLWIEGVYLMQGERGYGAINVRNNYYFPQGTVWLNRAIISCGTGGDTYLLRSEYAEGDYRIRAYHCWFRLYHDDRPPLVVNNSLTSSVVLYKCSVTPLNDPYQGVRIYNNTLVNNGTNMAPLIAEWVHDCALEPTDQYGPAFGEWYAPQWLGHAYRIAGSETLEPGDALDQTQIALYRETAYQTGLLEPTRWLQTSPDPASGEWEFRYLPTTDSAGNPQRYAVQINPPECYQAELLRWYTPEQDED